MKTILFLLAVGILEIILVGTLHELFGTKDLILIYLGTTILGGLLAWLLLPRFKRERGKSDFSKNFRKRLRERKLTEKDILNLQSATYCVCYLFGCVLIILPGIITDLIGILLVLPPVVNLIGKYVGKNAHKYTNLA